MTKQRLEREFTSKEMESWAQEVRRAMKEEPGRKRGGVS